MELGWAAPVHGKKTCAMQYAWQQNVLFFFLAMLSVPQQLVDV